MPLQRVIMEDQKWDAFATHSVAYIITICKWWTFHREIL